MMIEFTHDTGADRDQHGTRFRLREGTAPRIARALPLVLIAEDDAAIAEMLAAMVRQAGYRSLVALHGREALKVARTERPALLLIDLMLPYLDGAAVIAALRADAAAAGTAMPAVALMTAAGLDLARAAAADVVLRKPFRLAALEAVLLRFLGPQAPGAPCPCRSLAHEGVR